VTVSTWDGNIDTDFPIMLKPGARGTSLSKPKRYKFEIGGGGARINAKTFTGDIRITISQQPAPSRQSCFAVGRATAD